MEKLVALAIPTYIYIFILMEKAKSFYIRILTTNLECSKENLYKPSCPSYPQFLLPLLLSSVHFLSFSLSLFLSFSLSLFLSFSLSHFLSFSLLYLSLHAIAPSSTNYFPNMQKCSWQNCFFWLFKPFFFLQSFSSFQFNSLSFHLSVFRRLPLRTKFICPNKILQQFKPRALRTPLCHCTVVDVGIMLKGETDEFRYGQPLYLFFFHSLTLKKKRTFRKQK